MGWETHNLCPHGHASAQSGTSAVWKVGKSLQRVEQSLLTASFPSALLQEAQLGHCWLPWVARTWLFVLSLLFMFLSLPLNYSLTKGLINSYAGQLKRIVRDQFCSTDNEVAQKPSLNRRKGTFPFAFWSCSKPVDGEESSGHVKISDKARATWRRT